MSPRSLLSIGDNDLGCRGIGSNCAEDWDASGEMHPQAACPCANATLPGDMNTRVHAKQHETGSSSREKTQSVNRRCIGAASEKRSGRSL